MSNLNKNSCRPARPLLPHGLQRFSCRAGNRVPQTLVCPGGVRPFGLCLTAMVLTTVLASLPARAATVENPGKQTVHANKTDKVDFAPGGTIRITGAHGDLNIEGWDRPEVEVTVDKSTLSLYSSKNSAEGSKQLDLISVKLERKSATELDISTRFPPRTLTRLRRGKSNVVMQYQIHVPKNSNLVVRNDMGAVVITRVAGDLDARVGVGDVLLVLPTSEGYSVDAKTVIGSIDSDVGGAAPRDGVTGRKLAFAPPAARHRIYVRADTGGINIQAIPPGGPEYAVGKQQ